MKDLMKKDIKSSNHFLSKINELRKEADEAGQSEAFFLGCTSILIDFITSTGHTNVLIEINDLVVDVDIYTSQKE